MNIEIAAAAMTSSTAPSDALTPGDALDTAAALVLTYSEYTGFTPEELIEGLVALQLTPPEPLRSHLERTALRESKLPGVPVGAFLVHRSRASALCAAVGALGQRTFLCAPLCWPDADDDWLAEIFDGAGYDINVAINHVLDTPENHMVRKQGARTGFSGYGQQFGRQGQPNPFPEQNHRTFWEQSARLHNWFPIVLLTILSVLIHFRDPARIGHLSIYFKAFLTHLQVCRFHFPK